MSKPVGKLSGKFITFDGGEGGGKTTMAARLVAWLREQGHDVVASKEPGGTPSANDIRTLLVTGEPDRWLPTSELLLYAAARYDTCERLICPALARGKIVVSDRFNDSTVGYQGYGRGLDVDTVWQILNIATAGLTPDLTFILDLPPELAIARSDGKHKGEDRFERTAIDFHRRMHDGFLDIARQNPQRCVVIDATQSKDDVFAAITAEISRRFLDKAA